MAESPIELWHDVDASGDIYHLDDYSATRQVLEKQEIFQATISQSDADPAEVALMRKTGIKSLLMLPMAVKGEAIGLVELADSQEERTFTEHQVALAQFLANQAGSAIQNARLYQRAQQEIAERQEAQQALRESEARLSGVLESAMDAIIIVDEDQRIMFFNPAAEQMFRLRSSEVIGGNLDRLIPRQYHKVHTDHVRDFGEGKPSARQMGDAMTVWGVRDGGEVFPIEASISWIRVTNQRYFTAIVRDVTERVLTEQTLGQRIEEMSTINQVAQTVATVTDLPAAIENVAQLMNNLFNGRSAIIAVPDTQRTRLKVLAVHDRDQMQPTSENELYSLLGSSSVQRVFEQGQALVIHDAQISNLPATSQKKLRGHKMSAVMLMPLRARGIIVGILGVGTDEPDRIFSPEEVLLAESIGGYVAGAIATAQLFAREQQQRQVAESLRNIATTVTSSLDHQTVLTTIFEQLGRVVNYDGACISLLQDDGLVLTGANGISKIFIGNRIRLNDKNPPVQVFKKRQAMVVKDVTSNRHWESWSDDKGIRSWMGAPLVAGNKAIGLLTVDNLLPDAYSDDDAQILQSFASQAAIAIENASLYEQAQRVAIDEERQRLARELHDSVTQSLYSLTLLANGWGTMVEQGRLENIAGSFKQLGDVGQQALKEMRLLIHQLRPPILEKVGLVGALQQCLEAVEQRVSIKTRLLTDGDLDQLPLRVEEQLFYIALEALNNSLRHANATAISVRLQVKDSHLTLQVQDNGTGFEPRAVSTGMGLQTMEERAKVMGGDLAIDTREKQGTLVKATVSVNVDGPI
jgi:PAS domain S-box-containing protein